MAKKVLLVIPDQDNWGVYLQGVVLTFPSYDEVIFSTHIKDAIAHLLSPLLAYSLVITSLALPDQSQDTPGSIEIGRYMRGTEQYKNVPLIIFGDRQEFQKFSAEFQRLGASLLVPGKNTLEVIKTIHTAIMPMRYPQQSMQKNSA